MEKDFILGATLMVMGMLLGGPAVLELVRTTRGRASSPFIGWRAFAAKNGLVLAIGCLLFVIGVKIVFNSMEP